MRARCGAGPVRAGPTLERLPSGGAGLAPAPWPQPPLAGRRIAQRRRPRQSRGRRRWV